MPPKRTCPGCKLLVSECLCDDEPDTTAPAGEPRPQTAETGPGVDPEAWPEDGDGTEHPAPWGRISR